MNGSFLAWTVRGLLASCRKHLLVAYSLLILGLGATAGSCQQSPAYRITGVVVSERGGVPVPNCHVTAALSGANPSRRPQRQRLGTSASNSDLATDTDAAGHFTLSVPSAGAWQLYAYGRGFRQQAYDRHENYFSSVVLTPAAPVFNLVFTLEPDSAISGFVLDEGGEGIRTARVTLFAAESENPDLAEGLGSMRATTATDDRGHYEFAGLAPGDYNVGVQAEPWYAAGSQGRRFSNVSGPPPDPLLDVIYPQTWFPGVTDRRSAEVLSLHNGEVRQADFNLTPLPATHLHINPPPQSAEGTQRGQIFPQIERVSSDGGPFVNTPVQVDSRGQIDVGGLSPGLYRVTSHVAGNSQEPSFIRVAGGAQRTLDLSAAIPVADLTLHFEDDGDAERVQPIFTDVDTGSVFVSSARGSLQRRRKVEAASEPGGDRKLEVPPGRYRVTLTGDNDLYLAGISIKDTAISGRIVTIGSGSTTLNLKLARGRASVRGVASLSDKPLTGAMIMLVPATFGQPGSTTILRRDQTNTDGGFLIESVIPGDYILLAIDSGWTVNWRDPSTLVRYLVHGIPLTLQANASCKQDLTAQRP